MSVNLPPLKPTDYFNDTRSILRRTADFAKAHCIRPIAEIYEKIMGRIDFRNKPETLFPTPTRTHKEEDWHYNADNLPTGQTNLTLFVHGLRNVPTVWRKYIKKIQSTEPNNYCLAPHVALQGNCGLEEAAKPILQLVRDFLAKNPNATTINLIGTSNGSRIISYIETQLTAEEMQGRRLNFVSISGVHYGTKLVDVVHKLGPIGKLLTRLHSKLSEEFHWGSDTAANLLQDLHDKQNEWKDAGIEARHFFCTSSSDEQVLPHRGAFPDIGDQNTTTYEMVHGENHRSIVYKMTDRIIEWIR